MQMLLPIPVTSLENTRPTLLLEFESWKENQVKLGETKLSVLIYQGIVSIFREDTFIKLRKSFEIVGSEIERERELYLGHCIPALLDINLGTSQGLSCHILD